MVKQRVLIIESDLRIVQLVREQLLAKGYEVNAISEYSDTRFLREPMPPHLVVLGALTPGVIGLDTVTQVRNESQVPLILLCGRSEVEDRIQALELGADDCLLAPFEPRELVARIQAVLRRTSSRDHGWGDVEVREWRFKGLTVQSNRRRVLLDSEAVELTTAEFDLLRLLVSQAQSVLSREKILEELRGIEWEAVDRSIDILVSRLRDKLRDDPRRPRFIRTVRSVGYQFVGESEPVQQQPQNQQQASLN